VVTTPAPPTAEQWRQWHVEPEWSRFVDVPSHDGSTHRWHLLERGPVAPIGTIVCVHGNPTWSYLWRSVLATLGDRYRVIAVDQLSMGFSDRIGLRRYEDRVRDLTDVINALDIDGPIVIVGQDWGGAMSMGWAVANGDRLAAMVLCNTGIAVPAGRKAPWLIRLAAAGPMTGLVGHRTRTFVDGTLRLSWSRVAEYARDGYRAPYRKAAHRRAIAEFVGDVPFDTSHPSSTALANVAAKLSTITQPVLLAWGAADPVFDDSFALDLAGRMPHAAQHRYPTIGHMTPEETDVAGTIEAWLHDVVESRTSPVAPVLADPPPPGADSERSAYFPVWDALVQRSGDDAIAFVDGSTGQRTSFRELHQRVIGIAAGLVEQGLQPGDRVAVLIPPSLDLIASVYGIWRAGGVTVIADRGLGLGGLGRAVRGAHVDWVVGPPKALAAARTLRWAPRATVIAVGRRRAGGAVATLDQLAQSTAPLPLEPGADELAAVLFTSGATGPAKGVRYRHHQLAAQRDALRTTYSITRADHLVAAFAPFALYGPALGITSTIPDVDVTKPGTLTAQALGEACADIDATIAFASPAALANVVRTAPQVSGVVRPRFDALRLVLSAGAPVPVATLRATAALCSHAELHTPYGMTECLPVADTSLVDIEAAGDGGGVCVGRPVPGAQVMIVPLDFSPDAGVSALATGLAGEVLVRTPWLSDGYDQLWRTERDARPVDAAGAVWHRSGDVGHLDSDGRLWIEGRSVHVIFAVDGPLTPVPVEVAVERLDGIDRCAAVGVGPRDCQQLVVVVEQAEGADGLAPADLSSRVRRAVDAPIAAVMTVGALPVDIRHNTKIDRTAVATWAADVLSGAQAKRPW
jgi:olefin beta-lactone synthetase